MSGVDFDRVMVRLFLGEAEDLHQHFDDVGNGMVVVVQQDDMVEAIELARCGVPFKNFFVNFWKSDGRSHLDIRAVSVRKRPKSSL